MCGFGQMQNMLATMLRQNTRLLGGWSVKQGGSRAAIARLRQGYAYVPNSCNHMI